MKQEQGISTLEIENHLGQIRQVVRRVAFDQGMEDDLVQDCCAHIIQKEHLCTNQNSIPAWIRSVSRNLTRDKLARKRLEKQKGQALAFDPEAPETEASPYAPEQIAWVLQAFEDLPPMQKQILTMRYLDGKKSTEIARELEMPQSTVAGYQSRALAQLRRQARKDGWLGVCGPLLQGVFMAAKAKGSALAAMALASAGVFLIYENQQVKADLRQVKQELRKSKFDLKRQDKQWKFKMASLKSDKHLVGQDQWKLVQDPTVKTVQDQVPKTILKLDLDDLSKRFTDLSDLERKLLGYKEVEAYLEKHGRSAENLVAAGSFLSVPMSQRLEYLKKAVNDFPNNNMARQALILTLLSIDDFSPDTMDTVNRYEELSPDNPMPHIMRAFVHLKTDALQKAQDELAKAQTKNYMERYDGELVKLRLKFLEGRGGSPALNKTLSLFGMDMPELALFMTLSQSNLRQAKSLIENRKPEQGMKLARLNARFGKQLSTYGAIGVLPDLVGMGTRDKSLMLQEKLLAEKGDEKALAEIKYLRKQIAARKNRINAMINAFDFTKDLSSEKEAEVSTYMDQVLAKGEYAALLARPEVQAALAKLK